MNWVVKVISTKIKDGYRKVKHLGLGKDDVQETHHAQPFGTDANPSKDMIAVFAQTQVRGEAVLIGYVNKHQLASVGEHRIFSTNVAGDAVKFYLWLKNDGTAQFGGDADHLVRYSKLETAFNELKSDFNNLVAKFNAHTHGGVQSGSSTCSAILLPQQGQSSSADITPAKITEIKTL